MKKQHLWTIVLLLSAGIFLPGTLNAGLNNPQTIKTPLVGVVTFPAVEYNEWLKVQMDPSINDADKIASTIDTFFNLKYKSWMKLELLDFGFLFDRKNVKGAEDYAYERGLYYFFLVAWREFNTPSHSIESYKYEPIYNQLSADKHKARIIVYPKASVVRSYPKGITEQGSFAEHAFTMIQQGNRWLIRGVVGGDEMRAVYHHGTNFNEVLKKERKAFQEWPKKQAEEEAELLKDPDVQKEILHRKMQREMRKRRVVIPRCNASRTYYPSRAVYYAQTHTSDLAGKAYYNLLFLDFWDEFADCQNFVSQCIWYGLQGINEEEYIENHSVPMIDDGVPGPGEFTWWADSTTMASSGTWTLVMNFISMITNNKTFNRVGVQGTRISCAWADEGDMAAYLGAPHIMLITAIYEYDGDGMTDYNEIYISAHTTNRRNFPLVTLYPTYYSAKTYYITGYKVPE